MVVTLKYCSRPHLRDFSVMRMRVLEEKCLYEKRDSPKVKVQLCVDTVVRRTGTTNTATVSTISLLSLSNTDGIVVSLCV